MTTKTIRRIHCPSCSEAFPVDPEKVPEEGVHATCSKCSRTFPVPPRAELGELEAFPWPRAEDRDPSGAVEATGPAPPAVEPAEAGTTEPSAPAEVEPSAPAEAEPTAPGRAPATPTPTPPFGRRDPHDRARRLARVLVSDMIVYHPDRHQKALRQGTLREDFDDEVEKSWKEYVEQVGEELAHGTDYFREALNEILAQGEPVY